jgi:hypothetical protein
MWFTRQQTLPPLVSYGSPFDQVPGALGSPGTVVRLGGEGSDDPHSGVRAFFGIGLDRDCFGSLDGNFFYMAQRSHPTFSSNGATNTAVLARPFFNVAAGLEDADPAAFPAVATGNIQVNEYTRLSGTELNMRFHYLNESDGTRLTFFVGGRYLRLEEGLNMTVTSVDLPGLGAPGFSFYDAEGFTTSNQFLGGQVGAEWQTYVGPIFFQAAGKAALGPVRQTIRSSAATTLTDSTGATITAPNIGLYIVPTNAGTFGKSRLACVPEFDGRVGIDFNEYVRLSFGYTFLYLSSAVRPSSELNRNVNVQPLGSPQLIAPTPGPTFSTTTFWAQGLDVQLRFSF